MRLQWHLALFASVLASAAGNEGVSSVQKVIELLTNMQNKAKQMKMDEEVAFSSFKQFCTGKIASKEEEIKEEKRLIESLGAQIEKLESDIVQLSSEIDDHNAAIDKDSAQIKEETQQREKDAAESAESIQDFAECVDALERAIAALQKQNYDRPGTSEDLLQVSHAPRGSSAPLLDREGLMQLLNRPRSMPDAVKRTVAAFLEMHTADDPLAWRDVSAPEANAYEFQSGGIIDMLKKLHGEFRDKKAEAEKEEMNMKAAYEMVKQELTDNIENNQASIDSKTQTMQEKKQTLAETKKEFEMTKADLDEDIKYLSDLKIECEEKGKSFQEKQGLRAEEIEAIGKAIEIMKSPEVSGAADKHLSLEQLATGAATSLAQLRANSHDRPAGLSERELAGKFLRRASHKLHSARLGLIAERVSQSDDPFKKVKGMIEEMIQRLLKEAGEESEHKGWCDTEVGTNKITRTKLEKTIDKLTAKIDSLQAFISESSDRLSELGKEISELVTAMDESTTLRQKEKAKNTETIDDAQKAQTAVSAATAVLKDFYAKAARATALVQQAAAPSLLQVQEEPDPISYGRGHVTMGSEEWNVLANPNFEGKVDYGHKEGMQTFGKTYKGQQDESGGVLAMLEVIASDFATLEADTQAAEGQAANAYEEFMHNSKKSQAVKEKETEMLTADVTDAKAQVQSDIADLKATQDQLLAAERYYDKLKPQCIDQGMSYEERVKARQEEIESLQEALRILSGEDVA